MRYALLLILLTPCFASAETVGYVVDSTANSVLYLTDFSTGVQSQRGPSGIAAVRALDSSSDGTLYATSMHEKLWTIDPVSGLGTYIGTTPRTCRSIAFDPMDNLFGINYDNELVMIDTEHGGYWVMHTLFPYVSIEAFAIAPDSRAFIWDQASKWLVEVDMLSGSTTPLGQLPGHTFWAFDYGPDGLYAWNNGTLWTIDVDTVEASFVGSFDHGTGGFAITPEPSTITMLIIGTCVLLAHRHRKEKHVAYT